MSTSEAGRKPRTPRSMIRPPLTTSITVPSTGSPDSAVVILVRRPRDGARRPRCAGPTASAVPPAIASAYPCVGRDGRNTVALRFGGRFLAGGLHFIPQLAPGVALGVGQLSPVPPGRGRRRGRRRSASAASASAPRRGPSRRPSLPGLCGPEGEIGGEPVESLLAADGCVPCRRGPSRLHPCRQTRGRRRRRRRSGAASRLLSANFGSAAKASA